MLFKQFVEALDPDNPPRGIRGPYVPPSMWWNSAKGCIAHLEATHHTVKVLSDKTLHINGDLNLIDCNVPFLSVKFSIIEGKAKFQGNRLTNFNWAHKLVVGNDLDLGDNKLTSLAGINTHIKEVKQNISLFGNKVEMSILGLMMLPFGNLHTTGWSGTSGRDMSPDAEKAFRIIERYRLRHMATPGDRIIDAQHDLFDAGLERFAELA